LKRNGWLEKKKEDSMRVERKRGGPENNRLWLKEKVNLRLN